MKTRTRVATTALGLLLAIGAVSPAQASADTATSSGTADEVAGAAGGAGGGGRGRNATDRVPMQKERVARIKEGDSRSILHLKLAEGTDVRLRGGKLVSAGGGDLAALDAVLANHKHPKVSRLFDASEDELAAQADKATRASGKQHADFNLYYRLAVKDAADAEALLDDLNALDIVETAYAEPERAAIPTASFTGQQGYRSAASSSGIDADYAQTIPGGKAENVRIIDIEYGWNRSHEDLSKSRAAGAMIANGTPSNPFTDDHGTAVLGELTGDANASGVTGLAPSAWIGMVNSMNTERNYDLANAIYLAGQNMSAGDVMLIEQQIGGPNGCGSNQVGCVAVEYVPAYYDAIRWATSNGIIVIEAAGNGYQNLDAPEFNGIFSGARADSGAIIVGAGNAAGCTSPARGRRDFSNYGSRVDVQAWGECVTTTGYGDLQGGDRNAWYTRSFGGTSSASPMVAAAAAVLSSVGEQRGYRLTPTDVRSRLKASGTAQASGLAGNIGPLPNLRAGIAALPGGSTDTTAPTVVAPKHAVVTGGTLATTVPVKISWSATDASGIAAYALYSKTNGGSWVQESLSSPTATSKTFALTPGTNYAFTVAAKDGAGNWSAYSYGPAFAAGKWQENSSYVTYGGAWTRSAWAPAYGGYLSVAQDAGAVASFTFTGRSVAWVGSKATNRGVASVYVDGVFKKNVDLYSATSLGAQVLASFYWTSSGTHTIDIVVAGTAGRPKVDVDAFVRLT